MNRCPAQAASARPRARWAWLVLLSAGAAGCNHNQVDALARELKQARSQNAELREEARGLRQQLKARDDQVARLQALGDKRLELLFRVAGLKLGRTGGVDLDDRPGDDAVRVYLRPIDRDGHALKAAGSVRIQLFDLGAEGGGNLIARYDFPVEQIASHWHGGLLTYHYRFDCPWTSAPPKRPEVTVHVTFTDYLTGRAFTAQKLVTVQLPAPATAPAE
jgi:hypothetical protein